MDNKKIKKSEPILASNNLFVCLNSLHSVRKIQRGNISQKIPEHGDSSYYETSQQPGNAKTIVNLLDKKVSLNLRIPDNKESWVYLS